MKSRSKPAASGVSGLVQSCPVPVAPHQLDAFAQACLRHRYAALPGLPRRGTDDRRAHPRAVSDRKDPDAPGPRSAATAPRTGARGGARLHCLSRAGHHKHLAQALRVRCPRQPGWRRAACLPGLSETACTSYARQCCRSPSQCCPAARDTPDRPPAAGRLPERQCAGRRPHPASPAGGVHSRAAGAVPVGAQAIQDATRRRIAVVLSAAKPSPNKSQVPGSGTGTGTGCVQSVPLAEAMLKPSM